MAKRYVSDKTTTLYKASTGAARHGILIFGDELDTQGAPVDGRVPVSFRSLRGFVSTEEIGPKAPLEFYSIDVGQGDASFIVTPKGKKILVDGGLNLRALGFLIWKYRLDRPQNSVTIDLMVLSHADGDHLKGLTPILEHPRIHVRRIVHNGITLYTKGERETRIGDRDGTKSRLLTSHDTIQDLEGESGLDKDMAAWRDAVKEEGCEYGRVDSRTDAIDVGDSSVRVEVLGPRLEEDGHYKWLDGRGTNHSHTINGHSVVLRLSFGDVRILLSGDLNIEGAEHLLADSTIARMMDAHVLKSPHHGSHEYHLGFLEAVRPQISTISSGDVPDYGHPRASFLGALGLASRSKAPLIFSTEIAATFVGDSETASPEEGADIEELDLSTPVDNETARKRFKLLLPGIINVRTDGVRLFAARRVNQSYMWEAYGPLVPAPRPSIFE